MRNVLWMLIALSIPFSLCSCATRTIASQQCPQPAPLSPRLKVPTPDPILIAQCQMDLVTTSGPGLPSSCQSLNNWLSQMPNGSVAK